MDKTWKWDNFLHVGALFSFFRLLPLKHPESAAAYLVPLARTSSQNIVVSKTSIGSRLQVLKHHHVSLAAMTRGNINMTCMNHTVWRYLWFAEIFSSGWQTHISFKKLPHSIYSFVLAPFRHGANMNVRNHICADSRQCFTLIIEKWNLPLGKLHNVLYFCKSIFFFFFFFSEAQHLSPLSTFKDKCLHCCTSCLHWSTLSF